MLLASLLVAGALRAGEVQRVVAASAAASISAASGVLHSALRTPALKHTTLAQALPGPYRLVVITKAWSDANDELFAALSKYRRRLNRQGLSAAVVFIGNDPWAARRAATQGKLRVGWYLDPDGLCASAMDLAIVPSIALLDPSGKAVFSTPFLGEAQIKQVASHYKEDAPVKGSKAPPPMAPGAVPINPEGRYELR